MKVMIGNEQIEFTTDEIQRLKKLLENLDANVDVRVSTDKEWNDSERKTPHG